MQASQADNACMRRSKPIQYTIRGVDPEIDRALRARSRAEGASLNELALRALRSFVGEGAAVEHHDLDHLAGTWIEDPDLDRALEEQRRIDEDLWR